MTQPILRKKEQGRAMKSWFVNFPIVLVQLVNSKWLGFFLLMAGMVGLNACENKVEKIPGRTSVLQEGLAFSTYFDSGGGGKFA